MDTSNIQGVNMAYKIGAALLCGVMLTAAFGAEESKMEYKPLAIGALEEFGVLQSGRYGTNPDRFRDDWTDHFGAFVTQTAVVNENLTFNIGLGGLFQYQKKEVVQAGWGGTQYKNFFIGPTVADIVYHSDPKGESGFGIQFGLFPYKYNSTAYNLGEYLFRSGPYPAYFYNGTYALVNSTAAYMQGVKASYYLGNLTADLMLTTETSLPSFYDGSLGAVVKYKVGEGLLDLGAGVNFKHLLPVRPSRTSAKHPNNAYFTRNGVVYTSNPSYYIEQSKFYGRMGDTLNQMKVIALADSVSNDNRLLDKDGNAKIVGWQDSTTKLVPGSEFYTQAGMVVMANATLDPKKLFSSDAFGPEDLKIYGEVALLGVKNYPLFYEKRSERMPIMFGFNLPGFKVLDLIALQVEVFKSPWMNSYKQVIGESGINAALPTFGKLADADKSITAFNDISKRDDLAWSLLLKKELVKGAWLSGQLDRDHTRLVSIDTWAGPGVEPTEVLDNGPTSLANPFSGDWYWMVQFSFGI